MAEEEENQKQSKRDDLAESLNDLFTSVFAMVKSELQGSNNHLELVEKMNVRVAEEYKGYGDVASGLRVFVEQLKSKSGSFDVYVQQIETIEQQVTEFEAVISMLDKYVSILESKLIHSAASSHNHNPNPSPPPPPPP
ncbi:Biogenesis of lysosome-related organelles complex-1, subunit [Parasponia andersonii]|uniref:Biogenesis of lysosome-related organelles complex-1, subunit n=1 Tax=Parasponia andersonii TaxID=3476 RepID=A0A2P5CAG8_PARAD|nr:Biogenesis of lysosome-related organelles complex-1, subunit [Parasponia andersonii]